MQMMYDKSSDMYDMNLGLWWPASPLQHFTRLLLSNNN